MVHDAGAALATVTVTTETLPMARLGAPSRLPRFRWQQPIADTNTPPARGLTPEETENAFDWGKDSILPYRVQDDYDRVRRTGERPVIVLENGRLRATVAPGLGGRLLSLVDLAHGRELLFRNPVFQPANLAALNAWFSGGIEWNGLVPGHTPFSAVPVFSAVVETEQGPVLRLYEFDRIVEATWQVDLFLPPGEDRLYVHGRIVNSAQTDKLAYWWTNVAVPFTPGMRVVSPADYAIEHVLPGNELARFPFPDPARFDGSYPGKWRSATSVFFRKPGGGQPFIAALDTAGNGLAQRSTPRLLGRKFFYFGTGAGGQHWMDYLAQPGQGDYIEIQSGMMPTQNQRFVLPARSEVQFTEVYGHLAAAPEAVQSLPYDEAERQVAAAVAARFPEDELARMDAFLAGVARMPPSRRLSQGTAWGHRHEQLTGAPLAAGLDFAVPAPADFWDDVAACRPLSAEAATRVPDDCAVSPVWLAALARHAAEHGGTWQHALLRGIAALDRNDHVAAAKDFEHSVALRPSWLGLRQLALVAAAPDRAEQLYLEAFGFADAPPELAVEIAEFLFRNRRFDPLKAFLATLAPAVAAQERLRLIRASVAADVGDLDTLAALLDFEPATIREGEDLSGKLWQRLQAGLLNRQLGRAATPSELAAHLADHPIPDHLNFRMRADAVEG